jgi:hypothetical protein
MTDFSFFQTFHEDIQKKTALNERLCLLCEAQNSILEQLADSVNSDDFLHSEIESLDSQIVRLSDEILDSRKLIDRLFTRVPSVPISRGGSILHLFLTNTQKAIRNLVFAALQEQNNFVRFDGILEIESHIAQLILTLKKEGLFLESEKDDRARTEEMERHNERLAQFLHHY